MERNIFLNWQELVEEAVKRRKQQATTQEQLALFAGISKPTLYNFEQGRQNIKVESAMKILHALGLA